MTPDKIRDVVTYYHAKLTAAGIQPQRINPDSPFRSCEPASLLAHALYLAENLLQLDIEAQYGKANRHLTAIQMCLSFAGMYTLNELRKHNAPG